MKWCGGRNDSDTYGCGVGTAIRTLNAATEDPGTFTLSSTSGWVAITVAIH